MNTSTNTRKGARMSLSARWARMWPALLAVTTTTAVGLPAAIASYRHARTVVERSGDAAMAPWLPLSVDGMLLAALVVIWVRRHRGDRAGAGPWLAFLAGMVATIAANLAAAQQTTEGYVVALWPPLALAITLELVALVAHRTAGTATAAATGPGHVTDQTGPAVWAVDRSVTGPADRSAAAGTTGPPDPVTEELPAVQTGHADRSPAPGTTGQDRATAPGPDRAPVTGQTGPDQGGHAAGTRARTDEELLAALQKWADDERTVPGRKAVMDRFGIGSGRADRLRGQVAEPGLLRVAR